MDKIVSCAKILVVDDLKNNLLALEALLKHENVEVFKATSGTEALNMLITNDFAVAFIDVQMPIMNGFELAEFMRGTKKTKAIPIIFVTANAKEQSLSFKGYECGAVDFLLKPLDAFAVKSKANVFIELDQHKRELKSQIAIITQFQNEQAKLLENLTITKGELELAKSDAVIARNKAEKANEFKSVFLANMSHEIRTPLSAMLGFAELLREPDLTKLKQSNYIDILTRNGECLLDLINDILDLSKVEAGHLELEFVEISVDEIALEVVSLLKERAKASSLTLEYRPMLLNPKSIISDSTRVRQVLLNLVSNAIKFTQTGSVQISSYYKSSDSNAEQISIEVCDTGIGITDSQKDKIFEVYTQADETTTRRFGGTGLGLALARKIARSLGGDVSISKTAPNEGSIFLFEFKNQLEHSISNGIKISKEIKRTANLESNALEGVKVLVVDDSPDNQSLILHHLSKYGAVLESAENGIIGYEKTLSGDFDVVLMDIQMPGLDGYAATHKLRATGYQKPIIALTAHAMSEVKQKCLDAGFTSFITKPINAKQLITLVASSKINHLLA